MLSNFRSCRSDPDAGYARHYECTWDLNKSIPSLNHEGETVVDETVAFNHWRPLFDRGLKLGAAGKEIIARSAYRRLARVMGSIGRDERQVGAPALDNCCLPEPGLGAVKINLIRPFPDDHLSNT